MRDIPTWSYKLTNPSIEIYDKMAIWCGEQFAYGSWWPIISPSTYGNRDVEFTFDNEQAYTMFMLKWS